MEITQELLHEVIDYDPINGTMFWKYRGLHLFKRKCHFVSWNNRNAGNSAIGSLNNEGYPIVKLWNKGYLAHRVAWFYVYGEWPQLDIDHINRRRNDYRINNLRSVGTAENRKNISKYSNNSSGVTGVAWCKKSQKWQTSICTKGKRTYLGYFDHIFDAAAARIAAENRLGFSDGHGR